MIQHTLSTSTAADYENSIECFRKELPENTWPEQIQEYLSLFGSHERASELLDAVLDEPSAVFWKVIVDNWCRCDGLWSLRRILVKEFRHRSAELPAIGYLDPENQRFYKALPDVVTVYRGCGRRKVRGLAWTADREIAEYFARGGRFPPPHCPVVAIAQIAKPHIFSFQSRAKRVR